MRNFRGAVFAAVILYLFWGTAGAQNMVTVPEEAIDRITLMKKMTSWVSLFVLKEDVLGTIEPGKFADYLVLN